MEDLSFSQIQQFCFRVFHTSHHFLDIFSTSCWVCVWDCYFQGQGSVCLWQVYLAPTVGGAGKEKGWDTTHHLHQERLEITGWQGRGTLLHGWWVYLGDPTQAVRAESQISCAEGHHQLRPPEETGLRDTWVCYIPRSSVAIAAVAIMGSWLNKPILLGWIHTKGCFSDPRLEPPKKPQILMAQVATSSHPPAPVLQLHKGQSFKAAAHGFRKSLGM